MHVLAKTTNHGKAVGEQKEGLRQVCGNLREAGLTAHPSKCKLLQRELTCLEQKNSMERACSDPSKNRQVVGWLTPWTTSKVHTFLSPSSYYRKFVEEFAGSASPLHRLMQKGRLVSWTTACNCVRTA
ncbi:uncharacterized protein DEA37_0004309 [Paragonimus westermani]|uniref:Reverse transcriptase domain-containing protein n=1 Tax=Paragonimus westermani TaxID=34504 RepID=A0A5J4NJW6_9TREM|nr:uncharacterized protein DEA37_0004309 [Paragonimus westermani]